MNIKKPLYFLAGISIIIIIIYFAYGFFKKPVSTPTNKIIIPTGQGELFIDDIKKSPVAILSSDNTLVKSNYNYDIIFYDTSQEKSFLISILNPNFEYTRSLAETDFLQTLNITKEQACMLNVSVTTPRSINEDFSTKIFGLSFCQNGKSLSN